MLVVAVGYMNGKPTDKPEWRKGVKGPRGKYKETSTRSDAHTTHGESRVVTTEYASWCHMRSRCFNPRDPNFAGYGGRGISICERWQSFECFLTDMGRRPSSDYTVDRRDVNGNYEPDNCRWLTRAEQNRNRRDNVNLTFNGVTKCLEEWSREIGRTSDCIAWRLRRGWPIERVLNPGYGGRA